MARSEYVYVASLDGHHIPLATFTVKHEMTDYLKNCPHPLTRVHVYRMADGRGGLRAIMGNGNDVLREA